MLDKPKKELPPALHSVDDGSDYWGISRTGRSAIVTITKAKRDGRNQPFREGSGRLTFNSDESGLVAVPFGAWDLSIKIVSKDDEKTKKGWVVVLTTYPGTPQQQSRDIGFVADAVPHIPIVGIVGKINRSFKSLRKSREAPAPR